ncbi:MAG: DinB family protein [Candidatus Limnocylindrales bacterium]
MDDDAELRRQLVAGLEGGDTHMGLEEAVRDFPDEAINARPPNVPYSPWHILEHLRLTQLDILRYVTEPGYVSPPWPSGYWPAREATATRAQFEATLAGFRSDVQALARLIRDPGTDLLAPLAHAPEHTILREVRLVGNHNSYHLGEFAILRQVMGTWGARRRG